MPILLLSVPTRVFAIERVVNARAFLITRESRANVPCALINAVTLACALPSND